MKRRKFLLLVGLVLTLISCEAQNYYQPSVLFGNHRKGLIIFVRGDSNANGAASTITTCAANTLYNFNGTTFDEITTQSVSNGFPLLGSIWQSFATQWKAAFGEPVYLVNAAKGGTYFSAPGASGSPSAVAANSWAAAGDLRALAQTKLASALAILGRAQPDLMFTNLGVNDIRNAYATGDILPAMDNYFTWDALIYPGVPSLYVQIGRWETGINSATAYAVRKHLIDNIEGATNAHMVADAKPGAFISGWYEADLLHYTATMQAGLGSNIVRWQQYSSSGYSKWGRSLNAAFVDELSSAHRTLVNNWVTSQMTAGNYMKMEGYFSFQNETLNNVLQDWTFIGYGTATSGSTFTANDCMSFDGVDDYFATGITGRSYNQRSSQNSIIASCYVKTNSSSAVLALFGASDVGTSMSLVQNGVRYRSVDNTLSAGTETTFASGNRYSVQRTGGTTKRLLKNKVVDASTTQASVAWTNDITEVVAAIQTSGGPASFLNCSLRDYMKSGYTSFDFDSFHDATATRFSGW